MRHMSYAEKAREWVVDYSAARAKAIEWLGDRYLLARPVERKDRAEFHGVRRDERSIGAGRLSEGI